MKSKHKIINKYRNIWCFYLQVVGCKIKVVAVVIKIINRKINVLTDICLSLYIYIYKISNK